MTTPCLFIKRSDSDLTIDVVYVDDIIHTGSNVSVVQSLKDHVHKTFIIKDLGQLSFFLGIDVGYSSNGITLTQGKFTREMLDDSGISSFKKVPTPLPLAFKLSLDEGSAF